MNCLCCSSDEVKRFGRFRNRNGVVQRYRCLRCGKSFSESQSLDGLRLDQEKVVQITHDSVIIHITICFNQPGEHAQRASEPWKLVDLVRKIFHVLIHSIANRIHWFGQSVWNIKKQFL